MSLPGTNPDQFAPTAMLGEMAALNKSDAVRLNLPFTRISTNTTAIGGGRYEFTATLTLTLPASPLDGDVVEIDDASGGTTSVIARNGKTIMGLAEDMTLNRPGLALRLSYSAATGNWRIR